MANGCEFDQTATYQIRLKGTLNSSWSDWFVGLTITTQGNETVLVGSVVDPSVIHGILAKINDLGLSTIPVTKIFQEP